MDEWIKKVRCIYTIDDYSATKKDKLMPVLATWMELEETMLSKTNEKEKTSTGVTYM